MARSPDAEGPDPSPGLQQQPTSRSSDTSIPPVPVNGPERQLWFDQLEAVLDLDRATTRLQLLQEWNERAREHGATPTPLTDIDLLLDGRRRWIHGIINRAYHTDRP